MDQFEEQDYTKGFDFGLWKKLLGFAKKYKKVMIILILVNSLIAVIDTIFPLMTKYAFDNFVMTEATGLPTFAAIYAGLIIVDIICIYVFIYLAGYLETHVVYDVRQRGFKHLQELSFSYYDNTAVGWIMARMTSDAQRIGDVLGWGVTEIFWALTFLIFVVVAMLVIYPPLALAVLVSIPLLFVVSLYFQKKILKGHRAARKINSKITGAYNEGINGAKTTKTLVREAENFEEFKVLSSSMRKASVHVSTLSAIYMPTIMMLSSLGIGLTLWRGGILGVEGVITVGTLSMFLSYAMRIFEPIRQIAGMMSELQSAQASAERTFSLIETKPDVVDSAEIIEKFGDFMNPKMDNWPAITGHIEFKNVNFHYKTGEKVLEEFNLTVLPGQKIALVGETGSGKSTIVNLICRFYEPVSGQVLIDGVDYRERSQIWLQSNLGYVLQSPHLFSGTVMENIRYGKLSATDEEVINAAKIVSAFDFIMRLEKGFETDVGEGGNRLSTGEKQLISFARAILGDPRIFVLDEATSSIDTETEKIIQQAVYRVLEGRTAFIVAHRLSTIRTCDRILVIENGRIIENGTHKELIAKRGHYYKLYTNQFKEEAERRILG